MEPIDREIIRTLYEFIERLKADHPTCSSAKVVPFNRRYELKLAMRDTMSEFALDPTDLPVHGLRFINVIVDDSKKAVMIPNIVTPAELSKNGLGKALIWKLYLVARQHGYSLVINGLMPGFHRRLLARKARRIDNETVEIVAETDLITPVVGGGHL